MCRESCSLFTMHTRSDDDADRALHAAEQALLDLLRTHGVEDIPLHDFTTFVTTHFVENKHVWMRFRRDHYMFRHMIHAIVNAVIGQVRIKCDNVNPRHIFYIWYLQYHQKRLATFMNLFDASVTHQPPSLNYHTVVADGVEYAFMNDV
jgi:hypothetical protein